ncbi:hypothetical protein [Microbacterium sp. NPDC080220]|uniref:hypothetical protein n=1 Tax=Microbacterium sp. NPDC080220 TaxID=3161017 RepID=UPI00343346D5
MTGGDVATLLQALGAIVVVIAAVVTGIFARSVAKENREARKDRTPSDDNEATKIANELFGTLLTEAREERKELRETIRDLKNDGTTKQERIRALEDIDRKKTLRIGALESRARLAAEKLARGERLTVVDILGDPNLPDSVLQREARAELGLGDLEDTITTG